MLGIVFTEFQEFIEQEFTPAMYDQLLKACPDMKSQGIYTAVGQYDYTEVIDLVTALSEKTNVPVPDLVRTFGHHLFARFHTRYPNFFDHIDCSFDFLKTIEDHIHVEVKKLYPVAELPKFDCKGIDQNKMTMHYSSQRPFADLAEGLIRGCADHFKEDITIERQDHNTDHSYQSTFVIVRNTA